MILLLLTKLILTTTLIIQNLIMENQWFSYNHFDPTLCENEKFGFHNPTLIIHNANMKKQWPFSTN